MWYYGPSGTGKICKARTDRPNAYLTSKYGGDRYPFLAEHKGGARKIRPDLVIVTSNYHPNQIWEAHADLGQILRRFEVVLFPVTIVTPVI
jgi:hypothetical protein